MKISLFAPEDICAVMLSIVAFLKTSEEVMFAELIEGTDAITPIYPVPPPTAAPERLLE